MREIVKLIIALLVTLILFSVLPGAWSQQVGNHITGIKFNDANGNGVYDPDTDTLLPDWTIQLYYSNGTLAETQVTDAAGHYCFRNYPAGTYTIKEVLKPGYRNTSPTSVIAVLHTTPLPDIITELNGVPLNDTTAEELLPVENISFVGESRIGRPNGADYQFDINSQFPFQVHAQANYNWVSGAAVPFTIEYYPANDTVKYTVGGQTISWSNGPTRPISGFELRSFANQPGSMMEVYGISVSRADGTLNTPIPGATVTAAYSGGPATDIIYVQANNILPFDINNGFILTGTERLTWVEANRPRGSGLANQFKFGIPIVPPPETVYQHFGNQLISNPTPNPDYQQVSDQTQTLQSTSFAQTNESNIFAYPNIGYGCTCLPSFNLMPQPFCGPIAPGSINGVQAGSYKGPTLLAGSNKDLGLANSACGPVGVMYGFPVIASSGSTSAFNQNLALMTDNERLDFNMLNFAKINPVSLGTTLWLLYLVSR